MKTLYRLVPVLLAGLVAARDAHAAGTLAPVGAGHAPMLIVSHHVEVLIDNGFARTEVATRGRAAGPP